MDVRVYQGKSLNYILSKPSGFTPDAGLPLVILVHGFGASMYDLADLAPIINADGYVYAFPNAPYQVQLGPGMTGYSWMTGRPGMQPVPDDAPSVEQLLDGFLEEIGPEVGAEDGRIVLGGFSQGGGLTLIYGLPRPQVFAGLAVLSGFFRDADTVRPRITPGDKRPVFVAHGTNDGIVPIDAGRTTRAFLEELGYTTTYREYPMAHEISADTLMDFVGWLTDVMPPGPKK